MQLLPLLALNAIAMAHPVVELAQIRRQSYTPKYMVHDANCDALYCTADPIEQPFGFKDFEIDIDIEIGQLAPMRTVDVISNETQVIIDQLILNKDFNLLGDLYLYGDYVPIDVAKAISYYQQTDNDPHSHFMMGVIYSTGLLNTTKNVPLGLLHYEEAIQLGSAPAMMALAHKYQYGLDVPQSTDRAIQLYLQIFNKAPQLGIFEPHFQKYSFRLADLLGGQYGGAVPEVLSSLRQFSNWIDIRDSVERDDGGWLDKSIVESYIEVHQTYFGDYLHAPDHTKAWELANKCYDFAKKQPGFDSDRKGEIWISFAGRCAKFISHMALRGDGTEQNVTLAVEYLNLSRELVNTKLFNSDVSAMKTFGLGLPQEEFKPDTFLDVYYQTLSEIDLGDWLVQSKTWNLLIKCSYSGVHLAESKIIELWMDGRAERDEEAIMNDLAHYLKYFENIFHDFRDTFMAIINNDISGLVGLYVEAELGFEHAEQSISTLIGHNSVESWNESIKWLEIAAKHGNPVIKNYLGDLYYSGLTAISKLSFDSVDHILPVVIPEKQSVLQRIMVPALKRINDFFKNENDFTIVPDLVSAVSQYQDAATHGSALGAYNLAYCYEFGMGVAQDLHLAKRYYDLSLSRSNNGYVAIKLGVWRIKAKALLWSTLGWDCRGVEELKSINGWSDRLGRVWTWAKQVEF
ncbi:hypothetical protein DAMA08_053600 [Martiniozyma asiatica (nom. inval.)]|nr:hypothetical protein DAMA08_053600 [Martiniozyma asiatica]